VVDDRDPEEVEVVLRTGATITGWVVGLPPDEIALVTVVILDPHGASRPVHVDAEGRLAVRELPGGDWLLRASLWNGQRTAEARVPVASADDWVRRDLEFGQRLTLSGRVSLADEPLPRSAVTLRGERFDTERGISTGWDGTFVFDDL
jgi:hypothetical protein